MNVKRSWQRRNNRRTLFVRKSSMKNSGFMTKELPRLMLRSLNNESKSEMFSSRRRGRLLWNKN